MLTSPQPQVDVQTPLGTFVGEITVKSDRYPRSTQAFRGIPYAQSTAGENRFRPPQPITQGDPNTTIRAIDFGDDCPQGRKKSWSTQSENCLNLNLYRPHYANDEEAKRDMAKIGGPKAKLPVVIYVHGGGFRGGSGKERNMASFVAWAETPIIGINFNYRLGALGFLPSGVTQREGLLNLGLKDQQLLFSWVQKNVAHFGGDPDNVTLMGLSAGAHAIGHQMISYAPANKLTSDPAPFHKVIMESGGALARAVFNPTIELHETQFKEFLAKCGIAEDTPEKDIFPKLRALDITTLATASYTVAQQYWGTLRWAFQPAIDGEGGVVPDLPIQSWSKPGHVMRIPMLTGFDTNEGTLFVPTRSTNSSSVTNLMSLLIPGLNETSLDTLSTMYPDPATDKGRKMYAESVPRGYGSQFWRLDDAYAHYAYICPVYQQAHLASLAARDGTTPATYVYHFAARSLAYGATDHGDEAPIVSHDMQTIRSYAGLNATANAMTGFWTRFAAFGDPNPRAATDRDVRDSPANMTWTPFVSPFAPEKAGSGPAKGRVALFGKGNDERMGIVGRRGYGVPAQMTDMTEREKTECQFWWSKVLYSEGFGNGTTLTSPGVKVQS